MEWADTNGSYLDGRFYINGTPDPFEMDSSRTCSVIYACLIDFHAGGLASRSDVQEGIDRWLRDEEPPEPGTEGQQQNVGMSSVDRAMSDNMEAINKLEQMMGEAGA